MGSEQGGVYDRNYIGFRVEDIPLEKQEALHLYYMNLSQKEAEGKCGYSMFLFSFV